MIEVINENYENWKNAQFKSIKLFQDNFQSQSFLFKNNILQKNKIKK